MFAQILPGTEVHPKDRRLPVKAAVLKGVVRGERLNVLDEED
jgi:hypothetical protein